MKRILYTSLVDISLPYGPGVNERVFLEDLLDVPGLEVMAAIPSPAKGLPAGLEKLAIRRIPSPGSVRNYLGWASARLLGVPVVCSALREFQPDFVIMRSASFPLPLYICGRAGKWPFAVKTYGDPRFHAFSDGGPARRLIAKWSRRMNKTLLESAVAVDVVSASQKDVLVQETGLSGAAVHVIDNGVDLHRFRLGGGSKVRTELGIPPEAIVVGYVGNFPFRRGGKEVLDAVAALSKDRKVYGVVVGDAGEAEKCREYASRTGLTANIKIMGEVAYEEVPDLMSAMDVGLSILRKEERGESEQKVRQYLACGLSVVGTEGSNDFLRGHSFGRVVTSTRIEEVAAAVQSLISGGKEGLKQQGLAARRFAETHLSVRSRTVERLALWQKGSERARSSPRAKISEERSERTRGTQAE